uniref:Uncharacterized protein n=1 Tax=Meloidogyne hapla TaxID=6305 RepID=A0A1I8BNG7_MELHA
MKLIYPRYSNTNVIFHLLFVLIASSEGMPLFCGLGQKTLRRQNSIQPVTDVGAPETPDTGDIIEPRRRRVREREIEHFFAPTAPPPSPAHGVDTNHHIEDVQTLDDMTVSSSPISPSNEIHQDLIQGDEQNTPDSKQAQLLIEHSSNYPTTYKKQEEEEDAPEPYFSDGSDYENNLSSNEKSDNEISNIQGKDGEKSPSSVLYSHKHFSNDKTTKTVNTHKKENPQNNDKSKNNTRNNGKQVKQETIGAVAGKNNTVIQRKIIQRKIHPSNPSNDDLWKQIVVKNKNSKDNKNQPGLKKYNSC